MTARGVHQVGKHLMKTEIIQSCVAGNRLTKENAPSMTVPNVRVMEGHSTIALAWWPPDCLGISASNTRGQPPIDG